MTRRQYAPSVISTPSAGGCDIGHDSAYGDDFDFHLKITVIHTTPEGTFAALKLAGDLARDLSLRIGLLAVQLVPFRLPIEESIVSPAFLEQRQALLVARTGLGEDEVNIRVCLARDRKAALATLLPPNSLVVIGGRRNWWRQERNLEKWLLRMGHQVLFAQAGKQLRVSPLRLLLSPSQALPQS